MRGEREETERRREETERRREEKRLRGEAESKAAFILSNCDADAEYGTKSTTIQHSTHHFWISTGTKCHHDCTYRPNAWPTSPLNRPLQHSSPSSLIDHFREPASRSSSRLHDSCNTFPHQIGSITGTRLHRLQDSINTFLPRTFQPQSLRDLLLRFHC